MEKNEKEVSSFQVRDRRHFNPDGTRRQEATEEVSPEETRPNTTEAQKPSFQKTASSAPQEEHAPLGEIDFPTFMLSLASSAQISLGLVPHPATNQPQVNLEAAKQTIDILGMLEAKTKGNLTQQEEQILKQILFELRMHYVEILNHFKKSS